MAWGVDLVELIKSEGVQYEEYDLKSETILKKITRGIHWIAKKVQAIFVVKERAILVDAGMHRAKKPFAGGHELGHHDIPEHREILYVCSEEDLDWRTRREMEFEANVYGSEILIPSPLLQKIYAEYPVAMETILLDVASALTGFHTRVSDKIRG
ncbi:MAG: ImmA/IrrE family metallo-endopeptidase [Thermodesulfobacteriota bacterium]